jgi:hypothetical protein
MAGRFIPPGTLRAEAVGRYAITVLGGYAISATVDCAQRSAWR